MIRVQIRQLKIFWVYGSIMLFKNLCYTESYYKGFLQYVISMYMYPPMKRFLSGLDNGLQHTAKCRYNMIQYNMILHTTLQWF